MVANHRRLRIASARMALALVTLLLLGYLGSAPGVATAQVSTIAVSAKKLSTKKPKNPSVNVGRRPGAAKRPSSPHRAPSNPPANGSAGIAPAGLAPGRAGIFVARCSYSHSATDDPIVHPGMPGMSHLHDFFGNTKTNSGSTFETLSTGATTCQDQDDNSAYWAPATKYKGESVKPVAMQVYYIGSVANRPITTPPAGLKAVTGRTDQTVRWVCVDQLTQERTVGNSAGDVPTCERTQRLKAKVFFPACWDGVNNDSADHISHLANQSRGGCPATHPVTIPRIVVNVLYPAWVRGGPGTISLESGGPESMHADVFLAWNSDRLSHLIQTCLTTKTRCGPAALIP